MNTQQFRTMLADKFLAFAAELGYAQGVVDDWSLCTTVYAKGAHALGIEIDWRDGYLDMCVIRMVHGQLADRWSADRRLSRIPIRHIYDTELPQHITDTPDLQKRVELSLDHLMAVVRSDPQTLMAFIRDIDIHTSVENTKRYYQKCWQRNLAQLDQDYQNGKYDKKTYELLRKRMLLQMNG